MSGLTRYTADVTIPQHLTNMCRSTIETRTVYLAADVEGVLMPIATMLTELEIIPIGCSREQELAWKKAVKDLREATRLLARLKGKG